MPLTRQNVTAASRVMLPAYVVLTGTIGLVYTLDPGHRLADVPALTVARMLMGGSMTGWGLLFLGVTAILLAAFLSHRRLLFVLGLYLCGATFAMWACLYGASTVTTPGTSLLSPVFPLFVCACCYASAKSLLRGERD